MASATQKVSLTNRRRNRGVKRCEALSACHFFTPLFVFSLISSSCISEHSRAPHLRRGREPCRESGYSSFGIDVDRNHRSKIQMAFPQEKAAFDYLEKSTCIPKLLENWRRMRLRFQSLFSRTRCADHLTDRSLASSDSLLSADS